MRKCRSTLRSPDISDTGTLSRPNESVPVQMGRAMAWVLPQWSCDQEAFFARVFAAFFAAAERPAAPLVCAAFLAAADREPALRLEALFFAWADNADVDVALCPSFFNALVLARERFAAGLWRSFEAASSCAAFFFVDLLAVLPAGTFTPARRALDSPIA